MGKSTYNIITWALLTFPSSLRGYRDTCCSVGPLGLSCSVWQQILWVRCIEGLGPVSQPLSSPAL